MTTPIQRLNRPHFHGKSFIDNRSRSNQFAGKTTLSSGSATVTVSTQAVRSHSMIFLGQMGSTSQASGMSPIEVRSISDGNFFTLGTVSGVALTRDTTLFWKIFDPQS